MKIGIDFSRAFTAHRTGTEEYAYQLFKGLSKCSSTINQYIFYCKEIQDSYTLSSSCRYRNVQGRFLWTQWFLSKELWFNPVDVLFVPTHSIPIWHPKKTVVTIHGLEFIFAPHSYSFWQKLILHFNTYLAVKWSFKIITPSLSTKLDLIKYYQIKADKIKVIPHGFSGESVALSSCQKQITDFKIFFIGRLEKRKNLVNLIKAFSLFMDRLMTEGIDVGGVELVLAGGEGYGAKEIRETLEKIKFRQHISLKGYVTEEQKVKLYRSAEVFVFPSFYEGFGLPILEAMSHGVPVICSNTSALPEVAGDAALFINPYDIESIVEALYKIFTDKSLRTTLKVRGYQNLKRFSWDESVKATNMLLSLE